ncbi:MAG: hypothetical protein KJN62_05250 [Deltaproteobacteria bacterium]|nr:hypothetical protein [Deltaproteobacteria bacterium]
MTHSEILAHAYHTMIACNSAHNSTLGIFMDVKYRPDDDSIEFDILTSNMPHVTQLCELLNLTLHIEANSDPTDDKQINYFIN